MLILTPFQVSSLITALVSLFLGLFVYFEGEKTKLNFSWLLASISISAWSLGLFGVVFSTTQTTAWFWQYVLDIGGICAPLLYFNFLLYLTKKEKKLIKLQIFSFVAGALLLALNFTDLFKTGVSPKFGINYWIDPGKLYFLFPLYFIFLGTLAAYIAIREYRATSDRNYKRQIIYVLIAQTFGFGGGLTDFFPQLFHIYPFGNYFLILYAIFISYAAAKHHLFDMRVIVTELFTFAIWLALFIKVFFPSSVQDFLLNISLFLTVVFFGTMMIRSVIREVKQREKIERIEKELEKAYAIEKQANEELKNLDKVKNQFLMQAQHDLRTPLGTFKAYCEVLSDGTFGKLSAKAQEAVKMMYDLAESKLKEVNTFLDVSQFRLGKGVLSLKPNIEVQPILEEIASELNHQAESKGIYLKFEKSKSVPPINADREKLKAAIFNIVDNCIKFTLKGGVSIKIKVENEKLKIEVEDTGIGIAPEKIATLFDTQFERGEQAKKMSPTGKGIGLYLSGQIIKGHKGKIWVESEGEGKGSIFHIELPLN